MEMFIHLTWELNETFPSEPKLLQTRVQFAKHMTHSTSPNTNMSEIRNFFDGGQTKTCYNGIYIHIYGHLNIVHLAKLFKVLK